jgi:hypothetical protein
VRWKSPQKDGRNGEILGVAGRTLVSIKGLSITMLPESKPYMAQERISS